VNDQRFTNAMLIIIVTTAQVLSGCSAVTVTPNSQQRITTEPSYMQSQPSFLLGMIGDNHVNVAQICQHNNVLQMQSIRTLTDGLAALLSLGVYTPHTSKVWCETR